MEVKYTYSPLVHFSLHQISKKFFSFNLFIAKGHILGGRIQFRNPIKAKWQLNKPETAELSHQILDGEVTVSQKKICY